MNRKPATSMKITRKRELIALALMLSTGLALGGETVATQPPATPPAAAADDTLFPIPKLTGSIWER